MSSSGEWLGTNNGHRIDLDNPDPGQIYLDDICEGLVKVCRFNGQINIHYSVAEHSMFVAEMVPDPLKYQAILHDATEAYICDIPTPLKRYLGKVYYDLETRLNLAIGQALNVDLVNLHPVVKEADAVLCLSERDALQFKPLSWGDRDNGLRYPNFQPRGDVTAEEFREAVERYQELASRG